MIIFWYGENQYAISEQLKGLKQKYIDKTGSDGDMQTIDMSDQEISILLNSLGVIPMFVTSRLIVVRNLGLKKPDKNVCEEIISQTPDSTILVLIEYNPDRRSIYFKQFSAIEGAKEFKNLSRPDLAKWLQTEVKKAQGSISNSDALYLVEAVGSDQWSLYQNTQKLLAHNPKVNRKSIDLLVTPSVEYSSFALVDALTKKDLSRTLKLYDQLVTQGEADQMILGAIMYQYRVFLAIKAGSDAAKTMGIAPFAIQKSKAIAQNMKDDELKQSYNLLAQADLNIKTGELGSGEAMKQLFEQICSQ